VSSVTESPRGEIAGAFLGRDAGSGGYHPVSHYQHSSDIPDTGDSDEATVLRW
jgi:hypothetical protein